MGRPIHKKFFGQTNIGKTGEGVGGEGVASVTIGGSWEGFTSASTTVTFSAPQIPGGETATGTAVIDGNGAVTAVTITNSGSGYTSAPTVTIADSDGGAETTGTATAVLTTGADARQNSITVTAYLPAANTQGYIRGAGGSSAVTGDILRQVGSNKYVVQTAQGVGRCKLVADGAANAAGEMTITAVDSSGKTYYVSKLTAKRARLYPYGAAGHEFAAGQIAPWSFAAAASGRVQIVNR
jgi:hypothetical protein